MLTKKSVTILVIVAIIFAGVAIAIQLSNNAEEVSTTVPTTGNSIKNGQVGIDILPSPVEDKLANGEQS
jgi:hypothetical protein